jgi:hypothetical protein
MVVKIIIEMVRMKLAGLEGGVGSLITDLEEPVESELLRMNIMGEPKHAKGRAGSRDFQGLHPGKGTYLCYLNLISSIAQHMILFEVAMHGPFKMTIWHCSILVHVKITVVLIF